MANGFRCGFSFLILWCNLQWLLSACSAQNTHKFLGLMDYLAGSQPAGPSEKKHLQILINMGRQGKIMEGLMDEARWVGFRTYPHTLSKLASKMATNKTSTLRWWQSVRLVVVRVQVVPAPRAETLERPIADSLTFRWCSPRGFPRFSSLSWLRDGSCEGPGAAAASSSCARRSGATKPSATQTEKYKYV